MLAVPEKENYTPLLHPSTRGETIAQLHNRLATTLAGIIADADAEITTLESSQPPSERTSKAILICSHAAPLIAIGRALTGNMPDDSSTEDFLVFTAGLSTFVRRTASNEGRGVNVLEQGDSSLLAEGTTILRGSTSVPEWKNGRGVGGGWECVVNGDCGFLSGGAERGWYVLSLSLSFSTIVIVSFDASADRYRHFDGEESFDTGPMALPSHSSGLSSLRTDRSGTKL